MRDRPRIASIPLFSVKWLSYHKGLHCPPRDSQGDANRCRSFGRSLSASFRKCYKANDRRSTAHGAYPSTAHRDRRGQNGVVRSQWSLDRPRSREYAESSACDGILPTESIEEAAGLDYEQGYCEREQAYLHSVALVVSRAVV